MKSGRCSLVIAAGVLSIALAGCTSTVADAKGSFGSAASNSTSSGSTAPSVPGSTAAISGAFSIDLPAGWMGYTSLAKVSTNEAAKIDLSIKASAAPGVFGATIVVTTRSEPGGKLAAVAKNVRQQQESQLSVTTTELDAGSIDAELSAAFTFDRASTKGQTFTVIEILVVHAANLYIITGNSLAPSAAQTQAVLTEVLSTWHWT